MGQITRYIFPIAEPFSQSFQVRNMPQYCKEINCHSFHVHQCKECCGNHQPQTICVWLGTIDLPASAYPELRSRREVDSIAACRVTGSLLSLSIPRTDRFFRRKDRSRVRLRLFSRNDEGYKLDSSRAEVDLLVSGCKEHGHIDKHDTGSSLDYSDAKNVLGKTTLNCQQHDAAPGLQVNAFSESF